MKGYTVVVLSIFMGLLVIVLHSCSSKTIIEDDLIGMWLLKNDHTSGILIEKFDNGALYETSFSDYDSSNEIFSMESSVCFIDLIASNDQQFIEYTCLSGSHIIEVFMYDKGDLQIGDFKYQKK